MIDIITKTENIIVCIKPAGVISTDEPGGMPSLVREALGDPHADVRTVHRLDRVVSGLMLLALNKEAASLLGEQIMSRTFEKEYLAAVHGVPDMAEGTFTDLLLRDKYEKKTYVVSATGKGVQEAVLDYSLVDSRETLSAVKIILRTGRTHQIRAQFSSRGLPLIGDRKYSTIEDGCNIALWSCRLAFNEPFSGERFDISLPPPETYPWTLFDLSKK